MNDVERFTEGDCHVLARALHMRTGWPICAFDYEGGPDLHAFVRMPDGRLLDVEGAHTVSAAQRRWKSRKPVTEFDWRTFRAMWGGPEFGKYSYDRARVVAARLLTEVAA